MNEAVGIPREQNNPDRYKKTIMMLTMITTVLAAVLAALQVDAAIRADVANVNSQYLAILASGELHRAGLEGNHEFNVLGDYLANLQETTVLELTALEQEGRGDGMEAEATRKLAAIAQARAQVGKKFSVLFGDPRYAPETEGGLPAADQYLADLHQPANEIIASQNAAADEYREWDAKADAYVTVLTILAVAFFLFGLAQTVKNIRMRMAFTLFGVFIVVVSLLITGYTVIG